MIKERIREDMKAAMRAHDADRLSTIRLLLAAVKQREIDEKIEATDAQVTEVIAKMVKQRRDSIQQYRAGGREDLAQKEQAEIDVLSGYLPKQLSDEEIGAIIDDAIAQSGLCTGQGSPDCLSPKRPKRPRSRRRRFIDLCRRRHISDCLRAVKRGALVKPRAFLLSLNEVGYLVASEL